MSTTPPKEELLTTLRDTNASLTEVMQKTAVERARSLNYDLSAGRITIDETLINLTQCRNTIADAIKRNKLGQLPLKLQYDILAKTQRVAEALNSLVNGTDAVATLDDAVDDLSATIWQYHLHNLSDQVLGYEQKMNQLKAQEVTLAQATAKATAFLDASKEHEHRLSEIEELTTAAQEHVAAIASSLEKSARDHNRH